MALFGRRKKAGRPNPADELKISFKEEQPIVTAQFKPTYDDVLHALEVIDANGDKKRAYIGAALVLVAGCLALPALFRYAVWVGIVGILVIAYLIFTQVGGPVFTRRATAKKTADNAIECSLSIFPAGYQIIEKDKKYNIAFRAVSCYESSRAYIILVGGVRLMVFNKEIFGDKNPLVKEIFTINLGPGKRYFTVDGKGRIYK